MFMMRTTPNKSEAQPVVANSLGDARSRVATRGKLAGVFPRLNHFEPLKWSVIKKER
jgi:hypothetical protein